nr:unnamed protein product [Digitaria exilis]
MDALEEQQQHLPAAATQQAAADCVVINMEHVVMDIQLHQPAGNNIAAAASQHDDVNPLPCCVDMNDDDDDGSSCCCVVCTEPMEWVAVGRCGHRVMCSQCMVRIRFFHQNKRCCICRTRCPKVIVTRWPAGAAVGNPPQLPLFAFREGRVGHFWYHKLTAAYFEDQQQYNVGVIALDEPLHLYPLAYQGVQVVDPSRSSHSVLGNHPTHCNAPMYPHVE